MIHFKSLSSSDAYQTAAETTSEELVVSSCGKAILVGEHAVVHGAKAIAFPLKKTRMLVKVRDEETKPYFHSCYENGEKIKNPSFDIPEFLRKACSLLGIEFEPLSLEVHSDIMIGSGLGSSAALCVAIIRLLAKRARKPISELDVARFANSLEKTFHGNPSGLDTTTIALEKTTLFEKGKVPLPINVAPVLKEGKQSSWPFLLVDTLERMPTYLMIEKICSKFEGASGKKRLDQFNEISDLALYSLEQGNSEYLAKAMNESNELLKSLGVVTKKASIASDLIRGFGASAVKITGSGGGGCLLALLDPLKKDEQKASIMTYFGSQRVLDVSCF